MSRAAPKTFDERLAEIADRADVLRFAAEQSRVEVQADERMKQVVHLALKSRCRKLQRLANCLLQDTFPGREDGKKSQILPLIGGKAT